MIDKYHADGHGHYNQLGYVQDTNNTKVVRVKSSTSIWFYLFITFLVFSLAVVAYSL